MKVLPKHPNYEMYYAVYPDGSLSADFYNLSRAKDYTRCLKEYHARYPNSSPEEGSRSLTDAFKSEIGTRVALNKINAVRAS